MLPEYKNSWVLSVDNKTNTKCHHHYFCSCTKEFKLQTEINEPEAPDILCPLCGNDYFKNVNDFRSKDGTKIWKYFTWDIKRVESNDAWGISLIFQLPIYYDLIDKAELENQELIYIELKKDGSVPVDISYKSKFISRYSLFEDDTVKPFKKLLVDEAKENLYKYVMIKKSHTIEWIDEEKIEDFSVDKKLKYLTFFLKNTHLKEHSFYFWKMEYLHNHTLKYTTQIKMLNFISNEHKEKSVKKALYQNYENSIKYKMYNPYSDYIFSRSIENIDLLIKLYSIHPLLKQHLFTDETFYVAVKFIFFLKQHYTEKQIVKLFIEDMQDEKEYKNRLANWRDTLRMLQTRNAFNSLEEHFSKVKLTTKSLHDEMIRVFHILAYELDTKESFEYDEIYLSACGTYEELEFRLPLTVKELSLWAKILHNCMFGYSRSIHEQRSIIYGVFKAEELLYAVELNAYKIVQAKAVSNQAVTINDMKIIKDWQKNTLIATQVYR